MDWEDVKTFAAVSREGTVRKAANKLGVHHSTVSRRIAALEEQIGSKLFYRHPEGYSLTLAGEQLLPAAKQFEQNLLEAERQICGQDHDLSGHVTITMPETLATLAFIPALEKFHVANPGITLEIISTGDFLDVARREADVAIRLNNNPPETLIGKRLFPYFETVYCAADYLQETPDKEVRWLGWDNLGCEAPDWAAATEFSSTQSWGVFASLEQQLAACKAGLGLAMLPCFIADHEARLVRASQNAPTPSRDIWVLTHNDLRKTARVRAVMDFAASLLKSHRDRFMGLTAT